jgi:hypothetical protein
LISKFSENQNPRFFAPNMRRPAKLIEGNLRNALMCEGIMEFGDGEDYSSQLRR